MQYKLSDSTDDSPADGWIRCQDYNNNYVARDYNNNYLSPICMYYNNYYLARLSPICRDFK